METTILNSTTSYLTFYIGSKVYGINIARIQNIVEMSMVRINRSSNELIIGYLHQRGVDFPVLDLRLKLGVAKKMYNDNSCVLVVEICYLGKDIQIGVLVDSLCEVYVARNNEVEMTEAKSFLNNLGNVYGVLSRVDKDELVVINPDTVFSGVELNHLIGKIA
jgi:purine-binding chemotaxis protein CheW